MEPAGKRYVVYRSRSDVFTLWNLADWHYGNRACALDRLKRDIERIRLDPFALVVGGGDYADYIHFQDRRFDPECIDKSIKVEDMGRLGKHVTERGRDLWMPIRDKCVGLLFGNHEVRYMRANDQIDLHAWLCSELAVPNLRYSAIFDLCFVRAPRAKRVGLIGGAKYAMFPGTESHRFRVAVHHGASASRTPASKLKRLLDFMTMYEADIYMIGHVHDQIGKRLPICGVDAICKHERSHDRLGVISGSYLKTSKPGMTTYAEEGMMSPTVLGAATVRITPNTGDFRGEV